MLLTPLAAFVLSLPTRLLFALSYYLSLRFRDFYHFRMFAPSFSRLFTLCSAVASLGVSLASPLVPRSLVPQGPKFVVYSDRVVGPDVLPPLDQIQGFNVV